MIPWVGDFKMQKELPLGKEQQVGIVEHMERG